MKQSEIKEGGEYAYKVGYGKGGRCVRAVVTETPVEKRAARSPLDRPDKGSRIELPDEPSNRRHGGIVSNRDLVSTWAAYDRQQRADVIVRRWRRTVQEATQQADDGLLAIWNDLMIVIGIEADEHRFDPDRAYARSLRFGPEAAVGMAQRLTLHAGAAAYIAKKQETIERIFRHRNETIALAEKNRDEALAALDNEKEEQAA